MFEIFVVLVKEMHRFVNCRRRSNEVVYVLDFALYY